MARLETLPGSVMALVCAHLAQSDVVSLLLACPALEDACLRHLYARVVIDPAPGALAPTPARGGPHARAAPPCTRVRTAFGVRRFFAAVRDPRHAARVRSLVCRGSLPGGDARLIDELCSCLGLFANLDELEWQACPELPPRVLAHLPPGIRALCIDVASRADAPLPPVQLPNLRRFHVRPFLNSRVLGWLTDIAEHAELEDLSLSRYLDSKERGVSSYAFRGSSDVDGARGAVHVSQFFRPFCARPLLLKALALRQVDLSADDARALAASVCLAGLRDLTLVGTGAESNHAFVASVAAAAPRLAHLQLEWHAPAALVAELFTPALRCLSLRVRGSPVPLLEELGARCPHLQRLQLKIDGAYTLADLKAVQELKSLVVLDLPYAAATRSWLLALQLPNLKVLKLRSSVSQRPPGGLLTNGLLDQWNNHLCSPLQYKSIVDAVRPANLDYVHVAGTSMQLNYRAPPLEWYESS